MDTIYPRPPFPVFRIAGGSAVVRDFPVLPAGGDRKPGHLRAFHEACRLRGLRRVGGNRIHRRAYPPHVTPN